MRALLFAWLISTLTHFASVIAFAPTAANVRTRGPPKTSATLQRSSVSLHAGLDPSSFAASIGISEDMLLPAAAAVALLVGGAAVMNSSSDTNTSTNVAKGKPAEKINYNAAAQQAYENNTPVGTRSLQGYETYKSLYNEKSVAEVKIKVLQRKVEALSEEMDALNEPM